MSVHSAVYAAKPSALGNIASLVEKLKMMVNELYSAFIC